MPKQQITRSSRKRRRPCIERIVILLLLVLAWSWIAAAFLLVYHSMDNSNKNNTTTDSQIHSKGGESPLLIFTCRRAEYLRQTLTDVFSYLPSSDCRRSDAVGCPVVISQDGHEPSVVSVVEEFQRLYPTIPILHYQHEPKAHLRKEPYKELAVHYKWAIDRVFEEIPSAQHTIILEEDLHLAPDFFTYFERLSPLLDSDKSLLAISAYNDNGISGQVKDARRVVRSDFFPGLGWMLSRNMWESELSSKWPRGYWDDWLREPQQRQGRHILRPEVRTFGMSLRTTTLLTHIV